MILGKIIGKTSTLNFNFLVSGDAKKFQYIQVPFKDNYVLAQIVEIEKGQETIAFCDIVGYRKNNKLKQLRQPLEPGVEVLKADDQFIKEVLGLKQDKNSIFFGTLDGYDNLKVYLDLNKLLTKHVCVLAKSGSGKCMSPKTKILLEDGHYEEIDSLVDNKLKNNSYIEDGVEISKENNENLNIFALNEENVIVRTKIKAFMRREYCSYLILIKTRTGKEIKVTEEHKIPILNEFILWKNANQLKKGDFLLIPKPRIDGKDQVIDVIELWKNDYNIRVKNKVINKIIRNKLSVTNSNLKKFSKNFNISYSGFIGWFRKSGIPLKELIKMCNLLNLDFNNIKKRITFLNHHVKIIPSTIKVDKDFSKLFSYYLSEGHNNGRIMVFTNSCLEIQGEFIYLLKNLFNITPKRTRKNEFRVYHKSLAVTFQKLGFTNSSWTKFVPKEIITNKKDVVSSFLEGFIDCDGHIAKNTPSLEINLASKKLIDDIESMLMRFNIISIKKNKKINGLLYPKLVVYGSKNFRVLNSILKFKIKHKKDRLNYFSKQVSNPNIEIVPNISENLKVIVNILNMHESESKVNNLCSYIRKERNPSFETFNILLKDIEKKYYLTKENVDKAISLYESLPKISEESVLFYIKKGHSEGLSFTKISQDTNVSSTTAGRMVRGATNLTNNVYPLAENSLKLLGLEDRELSHINKLNINKLNFIRILKDIKEICMNLGYELSALCFDINRSKVYIYDNLINNRSILYSELLKFSRRLKEIALDKKKELVEVKYRLSFLKSLVKDTLFFDEIVSIKKLKYKGYVYDLETENHNFIANNLVVHNSYSTGVLVEEILEKEIPLLIIDPHGEYSTLRYPNDKDKEELLKFNIKPKGYTEKINEYSPNIEDNPEAKPLKLSNYNLSSSEIMHLLPAKLTNTQIALLYSALKNIDKPDFNQLILELEVQDNNAKYTLINIIEYLQKLNLFSDAPTSLQELIQPGKCSIINLKGVPIELQEVIVYKLMKDLFDERKKSNIPPFFAVIEEAHNFLPERNFGEAKSSSILRQIASEGRKFGLGLAVISQRPSRLDKSVISQATTQIILKVTNPSDVKAILNSVEGITSETGKEIKNIPIGTAMVVGVVDLPLFVNVRPRKTKHGGEAMNIVEEISDKGFLDQQEDYENKGELLQVIKQKLSIKDIKLMSSEPIKEIKTNLIPCLSLNCKDFNLLVNLNNGELIKNIETGKGMFFSPKLELSPQQKKVFNSALSLKVFTASELFSKSGVQFSDIYDIINILVDKGYLIKEGNKFMLSKTFNLDFNEFIFYGKPDFSRVSYNEKLEKKYNSEQIKRFLGNFVEIKNDKECWLVTYSVVK